MSALHVGRDDVSNSSIDGKGFAGRKDSFVQSILLRMKNQRMTEAMVRETGTTWGDGTTVQPASKLILDSTPPLFCCTSP
jgi:hypothetical protein